MARRTGRPDGGYVVVLLAVIMTVLLLITAMVIDNGFLRDDRRADQKVADAAATAAAVTLAKTVDGRAACESAVDSLVRNLPGVSSLDGLDCTQIPVTCDDTFIGSEATTGTSGPYTVTIVHPVANDDRLMETGSAIGTPTRTATPGDGHKCDRVGVEVSLERAPSFGAISSPAPQTTSVHTVALAHIERDAELPINLLILERYDCKAIEIDGTNAKLTISPIIVDGVEHAGVLAVESAGTGAFCNDVSPYVGTLSVRSASVRADGPAGCATEINVLDASGVPTPVGEGCGDITLYAPGVPGPSSPGKCQNDQYHPACTTNAAGSIHPHPQRMGFRYTRAAIDHTFNCKRNYTGEPWYDASSYRIDPCFAAPSDPAANNLDYVDDLRGFVGSSGTPPGFSVYTGPCTVTSPLVVPAGNVHVDCPGGLFVKDALTFEGGNVIFDGDVVVEASNGHLTLHACGQDSVALDGTRIPGNCSPTDPLVTDPDVFGAWARGADYVETQYSNDAAWTLFRNGSGFRKAGGAAVTINDSIVFLGRNATVDSDPTFALQLAGSSSGGALQWSATQEGPFENLAMWSDSEIEHSFAGQANLGLEGVFFAPMGYITYSGNGYQKQLAAQFITERLKVSGNGELDIAPNIDRSVTQSQARSTLIR